MSRFRSQRGHSDGDKLHTSVDYGDLPGVDDIVKGCISSYRYGGERERKRESFKLLVLITDFNFAKRSHTCCVTQNEVASRHL